MNYATMKALSFSSIGCFAYFVHLCVMDGKNVPEIAQLTSKAQVVASFFRTPKNIARLVALQRANGIFSLFATFSLFLLT
jgi:hypothetical protein